MLQGSTGVDDAVVITVPYVRPETVIAYAGLTWESAKEVTPVIGQPGQDIDNLINLQSSTGAN